MATPECLFQMFISQSPAISVFCHSCSELSPKEVLAFPGQPTSIKGEGWGVTTQPSRLHA